MEKTFKKEIHDGYKIGEHISIHKHINNPDGWFLTIRRLDIFALSLCPIYCTEAEIARYVNMVLHKRLDTLQAIIKDVIPFT